MQVIFLQSYYSSMKKSETISLALEIEEKINDDDIKDVIDKIIKQEDDENILEYLYEHELIGEKTHKKIKRKLK